MTARTAWGFGLATVTDDGTTLDVWFPSPALGSPVDDATAPASLTASALVDAARGVRVEVVRTVMTAFGTFVVDFIGEGRSPGGVGM